MVMIFGIQRFVISAGSTANHSKLHTSVASDLEWLTGTPNLPANDVQIESLSNTTRRLSSQPSRQNHLVAYKKLLLSLRILAYVSLSILVVVVLMHYCWRRHVNRRFYVEQESRRRSMESGAFYKDTNSSTIAFKPFPGIHPCKQPCGSSGSAWL